MSLSAGSSKVISDMISSREPELDIRSFYFLIGENKETNKNEESN
jgi:hypothetical protein